MSVFDPFLVFIFFLDDPLEGEHTHRGEEGQGAAKRQNESTFEANRAHGDPHLRTNPSKWDEGELVPSPGTLAQQLSHSIPVRESRKDKVRYRRQLVNMSADHFDRNFRFGP
jgi:hypothetical protein